MVAEVNNVKLGNRVLEVRNWKVRDRNAFKDAIKNSISLEDQKNKMYEYLVMNMLSKPVALNRSELEFLLIILRAKNIGNIIDYRFKCDNCGERVTVKLPIEDILKTEYGEIKDISIDNIKIELQDVQNVAFYNETLAKSNHPILDDLILHIKSVDGDDKKSYKDLIQYFSEFDINLMDKILDKFESMIFRITSRDKEVVCPNCQHKTMFYFDNIPELIPAKWYER